MTRVSGWCSSAPGALPQCERCKSAQCEHECHFPAQNKGFPLDQRAAKWENESGPAGARTPVIRASTSTHPLKGSASRG